jgi:hypothetical protein
MLKGRRRTSRARRAQSIAAGQPRAYDGARLGENQSKRDAMKNPLDSLGQTVALGVVLTIVMTFLIQIIAST